MVESTVEITIGLVSLMCFYAVLIVIRTHVKYYFIFILMQVWVLLERFLEMDTLFMMFSDAILVLMHRLAGLPFPVK